MSAPDHQLFSSIVNTAVDELRATLQGVDPLALHSLLARLQSARRLACYGVGREGLAMRGFAMRLHHTGLQVSVVGEMTAAALGPGDLLLVSAGPGHFSTVAALAGEARSAGADVVAFTSVPPSELRIPADLVVRVPAWTMADEGCGSGAEAGAVDTAVTEGGVAQQQAGAAGGPPRLPMGSSYELALQLLCDAVCLLLHRALQVPEGEMRQRHTNME